MGDKSDIQWTDATANVVVGCSRVSEGCKHCYAERLAATRLKHTDRYAGLAIVTDRGNPQWTGATRLVVDAIEEVIRWKRPRKVFLTAMGDPFHEGLSNEQIAALFGLMAVCQQHTFQVLTKRPKRMRSWFDWAAGRIALEGEDGAWTPFIRALCETIEDPKLLDRIQADGIARAPSDEVWPLPNVWLGVSVENQAVADERIPELLSTPAAVRFLSCEPLLGTVNLDPPLCQYCNDGGEIVDGDPPWCVRCDSEAVFGHWLDACASDTQPGINWVIVGGESGPNARPFDLAWARSIVEQCESAGVAVFVKQLGAEPVDGDALCKCGHTLTGHWLPFPAPCRHGRRPAPSSPCEAVRQVVTPEPEGACPCIAFSPIDERHRVVLRDSHGGDPNEWPEDLRVQEFPTIGGAR